MSDALPPVSADDLDKARQAMGLPPQVPGDGVAVAPQVTTPWQLAEAYIAELETQNARLREELRVTEALLQTRQQVLEAIPPCPAHGPCVPHALSWIARHRTEGLDRR